MFSLLNSEGLKKIGIMDRRAFHRNTFNLLIGVLGFQAPAATIASQISLPLAKHPRFIAFRQSEVLSQNLPL